MKNRAFTLMEVLVSILIISVVAVALFQISTNSKQNFSFLTQKSQFDSVASITFLHDKKNWHRLDKTLYDFIKNDYNISDDDFIKILKNEKIHYTQEEVSLLSPFEDLAEGTNVPNLKIKFDKIEVSNKEQNTYVYKISIE